MIENLDGVGRSSCIMRCNELENCNFLSSYKNKGCYLYETCNDKFTTPKKRKLYQKPTGTFLLSKKSWNLWHHILWYYKSYVIYLGHAYYGPKMLGVTYSNQKDDYIKNVEIGSRSGMVYGEAVSVEIENQSAQTVTILCRDKL